MLAAGEGVNCLIFLLLLFFSGGGGGGGRGKGTFILTLMGFCQESNREFFFWHFSVTYNVSFTKIICINMPYRLNVFFSCIFFMKFNFLAI